MHKSKITFDWQQLADHQELPPLARAPNASGWRRRWLIGVAGLLALTLVSALWVEHQAEAGLATLERELILVAEAEAWARPTASPHDARADFQAGAVPAEKILATTIQSWHGDLAAVLVETQAYAATPQDPVYHQLRFFRATDQGWVSAAAEEINRIPRAATQTDHFTLYYAEFDAATVTGLVDDLDTIYATLRQDYALPPATRPIVIELFAHAPPFSTRCQETNRICVESPALTRLTTDSDPSDLLQYWVLDHLVKMVRGEAAEIAPLPHTWYYAIVALPRYQVRAHSPFFAAWSADLKQWLYQIPNRPPHATRTDLAAVCATHSLHGSLGGLMGEIAYHPCRLDMPHNRTATLWFNLPPRQLAWLITDTSTTSLSAPWSTGVEEAWSTGIAFETVLDYVVTTYGRDALPALLEGFRTYETWHELIPAVFGVSTVEFEAEWQAYLEATYPQDAP